MLVKAKRLGWNRPDGGATQHDDHEPPAWVDDGADEWVEGELVEETFPADEVYAERKVCTVGGQLVDPETIKGGS